ncbi:MAG: hypothetical protein JWR26_5035 [Pedosphaera sp.]|nr:hypothetical protein [Pedosphaera sp.]
MICTDWAVEGSWADFWFYVAAPGDGRRPLQSCWRAGSCGLLLLWIGRFWEGTVAFLLLQQGLIRHY